jgi:hypothetical protein
MHSPFPFAHAALAVFLTLFALSCGSSTTATKDAGHTAEADSGCASTDGETLTGLVIKNFDGWCTVLVNGDVSSTGSVTNICQKPGAVTLSATANTGFTLGSQPWHDTETESGGSATVTLTTGSTCVWVCCPGASGTPACPTADQCP